MLRLQGTSVTISKSRIFHPFAPNHCLKVPKESNKMVLDSRRTTGLGSHQNKPQRNAGPSWWRPCTITSPTAASQHRYLPVEWVARAGGVAGAAPEEGDPSWKEGSYLLGGCSQAIRVCSEDFPIFSFTTSPFSCWNHWEFGLVAVVGLALNI